jgi:hypothetical protein
MARGLNGPSPNLSSYVLPWFIPEFAARALPNCLLHSVRFMSAITPKADIRLQRDNGRYGPIATKVRCSKFKGHLRRPVPLNALFVQATGCAFRFLRQPSRPKPAKPVAKSGRVAGSGVCDVRLDRSTSMKLLRVSVEISP